MKDFRKKPHQVLSINIQFDGGKNQIQFQAMNGFVANKCKEWEQ